MKLRATKGGEFVYANQLADLMPYIKDGWDIEEYVVGLGWVL